MREIKFRAWDKVLKRMLFPKFIGNGNNFCSDDLMAVTGVIELLQYTGLKDKNGKEIYDGDVLKYHQYCNFNLEKETSISFVKWGETGDSDGYCHGKHFEWVIGGNNADSLADIYENSEIIGNIYENPELLTANT